MGVFNLADIYWRCQATAISLESEIFEEWQEPAQDGSSNNKPKLARGLHVTMIHKEPTVDKTVSCCSDYFSNMLLLLHAPTTES